MSTSRESTPSSESDQSVASGDSQPSHAWILPDPPELIRLEAMRHVDSQGEEIFTEVNLVLCHELDFFVVHLPTTPHHLRAAHLESPGMYRQMWAALVESTIYEHMNPEQREVVALTFRFYDWACFHQDELDTAWPDIANVLGAAGILSSLRRLEQQDPIPPESLLYNFTSEVSRLFPGEFPPPASASPSDGEDENTSGEEYAVMEHDEPQPSARPPRG